MDESAQRLQLTGFKLLMDEKSRKLLSDEYKKNYPGKVGVILERHPRCVEMPVMARVKYVVPEENKLLTFYRSIVDSLRKEHNLRSSTSVFLHVGGGCPSLSMTFKELRDRYMDKDGFVYLTYADVQTFG